MRKLSRNVLLTTATGFALLFAQQIYAVTWVPRAGLVPEGWMADVALVLSGDPGGLRTLAAGALVKAGRARRLMITGAGAGGDSSRVLAQQALNDGLSPELLILEERATSTWENMEFSHPVLRGAGARRVVIVTSRVHARRAYFVARRVMSDLDVCVEPVDTGDTDLKNRLYEVGKAWAYLGLGRLTLWEVLFSAG
ncbi:MAG: YdcF family protein [Deltaproteobacteria bacterium]|nr:YdcF family protein [Deltaproteobacteria bacterium]